VVARRGDVCTAELWWSRTMVVRWPARLAIGCVTQGDASRWPAARLVARVAVAAAMVMEGEEKIRVRVLGDEDDDVAESDWLIW